MYRYDQYDQQIVKERVAQYRDQVRRRLSNELAEAEFLPLRLQNGLYMQVHAYMLRIAVPYGLLSSEQMRMFSHIARKYDRGYGHFTTRQNIQFNWLKLEVLNTVKGSKTDSIGTVEFKAYFMENGKIDVIHENSSFCKENKHWIYLKAY